MVYEFAIEPAALSTWDKLRIVVNSCGVEHGRIIAKFPHKWKKMVHENCIENPSSINRKRFVERLHSKSIDHMLISLGRDYNPDNSWLDNAQKQNYSRPFHAIVTNKEVATTPNEIPIDEVDENHRLWHIEGLGTPFVQRIPETLLACVQLLLATTRKIYFIDPFFDPQKDAFKKTFKKFFECAFKNKTLATVEIHTRNNGDDKNQWSRKVHEALSQYIPQGYSVLVNRWGCRDDRMHPRYIIAEEYGGIQYDYGLDADLHSTTRITLRSREYCIKELGFYKKETSKYMWIDEITVKGRSSKP